MRDQRCRIHGSDQAVPDQAVPDQAVLNDGFGTLFPSSACQNPLAGAPCTSLVAVGA